MSGQEYPVASDSDADLMAASVTDPMVFAAVYDRHAQALGAFLARRVGTGDAEPLLGDVFRIAFERRAAFDVARESALPWLFGIAANMIRSQRRSEMRQLRALARLRAEREAGEPYADDVVSAVDAATLLPQVADALRSLNEIDREALLLFAWEGLSYAEIAEALDVPIGTVRSRINRARQRLRELLALRGEE
jgi:RNA polymerase sigma factor (sigma-70 family)